jgi:hypothetical protein
MKSDLSFGHLNFEPLNIVANFDPPASPYSHGGQVFGLRIYSVQ